MKTNGQTKRIYEHLLNNIGKDVPSVDLHRIGSGKEFGWCGSLSRRISDCRKIASESGMILIKSKDVYINGQRYTWYRLDG